MPKLRYHPFYCEENVWYLCGYPRFRDKETLVIFISNPGRTCAMWHMKAAISSAAPVIWDYHVVLAFKDPTWLIWDLDSRLDQPVLPETYLDRSFRSDWPQEFQPLFRLVAGNAFRKSFSSDRGHMISEPGGSPANPPPWPPIGNGASNLSRFIDMSDHAFTGEIKSMSELRSFLGG